MRAEIKILVLLTGGTIACTGTKEGYLPNYDSAERLTKARFRDVQLLHAVVEVKLIANEDSVNITCDLYESLARIIKDNYLDYDGFVILHGTDTMAYGAASLSYLVQNPLKPIILTGSQKPLEHSTTDGYRNYLDSLIVACSKRGGVFVVFHGNIYFGTHIKKMHTLESDAFTSCHVPLAGRVNNNSIKWLQEEAVWETTRFYSSLNERVCLVKIFQGMRPRDLLALSRPYKAVVIEMYGAGALPNKGVVNLNSAIETLIGRGKTIVVVSQVPFGAVDMTLYETGTKTLQIEQVIVCNLQTAEGAFSKLRWALTCCENSLDLKRIMLESITEGERLAWEKNVNQTSDLN